VLGSQYNLAELRVVTERMRFLMRPSLNQWPSRPAIVSALRANAVAANSEVSRMVMLGDLSVKFTEDEVQHVLWRLVAARLGLTYRREAS
jgi:hypothetical protein